MTTPFHQQISELPTEQLLAAYSGQRNPFNTKNKLAPGGEYDIGTVLKSRGVDTSKITVHPGGVVHHGGLRGIGEDVLGTVAKFAPALGLIPGLGIPAAALIGGGARALQGASEGNFNLGDVAKSAAGGAAGAFANQALLGGRGILGVSKLLGGAPGAAPAGSGGLADVGNAGAAEAAAGGGGGILGGIGSSVLDYIKKNPLKAAQIGLAGMNVINSAKQQGRANSLLNSSISGVQSNINPPVAPLPMAPANPYAAAGYGGRPPAVRAAQLALAGG
jgi:hypothetical protein